jgi:ribosome-binding ATPase YchF (GTP1/OBG family)
VRGRGQGSLGGAAVWDKRLLHVEGQDYTVQDGDVAHMRFNV